MDDLNVLMVINKHTNRWCASTLFREWNEPTAFYCKLFICHLSGINQF